MTTRGGKSRSHLHQRRAQIRVYTSRGDLTAREVILASGAYTTEATPALQKKIIPIGSYIIATEILPADLARELSPATV